MATQFITGMALIGKLLYLLINAVTFHVGTMSHFSGKATYQDLTGPNACGV